MSGRNLKLPLLYQNDDIYQLDFIMKSSSVKNIEIQSYNNNVIRSKSKVFIPIKKPNYTINNTNNKGYQQF